MTTPDHEAGGGDASPGQLQRLSRWLLVSGLVMVALALVLQWLAFHPPQRAYLGEGITTALAVQLFTLLGTVALTGAVFGYLLNAMRVDSRETDSRSTVGWDE